MSPLIFGLNPAIGQDAWLRGFGGKGGNGAKWLYLGVAPQVRDAGSCGVVVNGWKNKIKAHLLSTPNLWPWRRDIVTINQERERCRTIGSIQTDPSI